MSSPRLIVLGAFVALLPVSIDNPAARDSAGTRGETRVSLVGAIGHYAVIDRGCEGQVINTHPRPFQEVGIEAQHRLPSGITAGLRGGAVRDRSEWQEEGTDYSTYPYQPFRATVLDRSNTYLNPSLGYEGRGVGLWAGWIWSREPFVVTGSSEWIRWSAHLRLGSLNGTHFRTSFMEAVPLYSGGGYFELGVGSHSSRLWDWYGGIGLAPYDGPGLVVKIDYRVRDHLALVTRARLGNSGGEPQYGVGLGITYVSTPPIEPPPPRHWDPSAESSWGFSTTKPAAEGVAAPRKPEYGKYQRVDSLPALLKRTECRQPELTAKTGISGTVTVAALIGEDGHVSEVRMITSIPALDEAAKECVRQWVFTPAKRSGRPVAYWMAVPVTWDL